MPVSIIYDQNTVGKLHKLISMTEQECIGEIQFDNNFVLTPEMRFFYREAFVGNSYLEIKLDSSITGNRKKNSAKDNLVTD